MKHLLIFITISTLANAQNVAVCVRQSDGAVGTIQDMGPVATSAALPPIPGSTWRIIAKSAWPSTVTTDQDVDDPPVYAFSAGSIHLRNPALVAADRGALRRISAKKQFMQWRQTLTEARQSLSKAPGDSYFQAQVDAAATQVISYASAASIPVTTATTQ